MGEGGRDTATVEVHDAPVLAARENDAPVEGVAALWVEQAKTLQELARVALSRQMTAQAPSGGIADPQFFDQDRIPQSALLQISARFSVTRELLLIEGGGFLEYGSGVRGRNALLLEVGKALAEG